MHKKSLSLIAVMTVLTSLLFGEVWESNALSMKLRPLPEIPEKGYWLKVDENSETLYLDDQKIRTKKFLDSGFSIEEDGVVSTYTLDEAGRPLRMEEGDTAVQNTYSKDGLLLSSTTTGSDGVEIISEYHWSPEGRLMYVEEVDLRYYLPSTRFHYSLEDSTYGINTDVPDVFIEKLGEEKSKVEVLEDSVKLLSPDGSERTYSNDGMLLHEMKGDVSYDHSYEDGILQETVETSGNKTTKYIYEDGILSVREYYTDGILGRRQNIHDDGSITEERYRNGKPHALVTYDRDQKTIRSIESL